MEEEVQSAVRATILSIKGGISIENLNANYRALEGGHIPYRKFGYQTLKDFVKNIPKLRIYDRAGSTYVEVVPNEDTIHLSQMISKQKCSKPNRKKAPLSKPRQIKTPTISRRTNSFTVSNNRRTDSRSYNLVGDNNQPKSSFTTPFNKMTSNYTGKNSGQPTNRNTHSYNHPISHGIYPKAELSQQNYNNKNIQQNFTSPPSVNYAPSPLNININPRPQGKLSDRLIIKTPEVPPTVEENVNVEKRVTFAPDVKSKPFLSSSLVSSPLPSSFYKDNNNSSKNNFNDNNNISRYSSSMPKQLTNILDPREKLLMLVEKLNMPKPEYTKKCGNKKGIYCQVSVGKNKWISYPHEAKSEEEAEKIAADQALIGLYNQYEKLNQVKLTTDINLIKQRLIDIINIHKSGMFVEQLPFYYKDKYNEALPDDWINIAEECPTELSFDNGVANSTILVPYNPKVSQINLTRNVETVEMKKLVLPSETDWPIYIKNFINIDEMWGIIIGESYSDEDYAMSIEMVKFYQTRHERAKTVDIDNYYVVKTDDGCHRVRVDAIDTITKQADVFFIDFGDYDLVSYNELFVLDQRFYNLPPQAIRFSLADLEEFGYLQSVKNIANELLQNLSGYCRVMKKKEDDDGLIISGTFYDTSGDDQININEAILQKLWVYLELPHLNETDKICEVLISHIELNQDIYIHINNQNLKIMNILLNKLMSANEHNTVHITKGVDYSKVYLVRGQDNQWLRAKIINQDDDNYYKVLLIDYGSTMTVDDTKLRQLSITSVSLEKYSPLAYKILLNNVETLTLTQMMVDRLKELAPSTEKLVCKVIKISQNSSKPIVELFKRNEVDNVLISINNTLVLTTATNMTNEDNNNNIRVKKRLERNYRVMSKKDNGLGLLSKPSIPDIDDLFDVHITSLVSNPYHFIIQPYNSTGFLSAMIRQLDEYCNNYNGPKLSDNSLSQGTLCAAKYMDKWHRAYIMGTIQEQVVIYLCDTGEMTTIFSDQILPLEKSFLELPYQAMKAKLYGVKPVATDDWSPLTSNRFKELVADKDFVSIIRNIERDENAPTKLIITLELIDTSTEKDIKIHQILIDENRAKELTVKNN